MDITYDHKFKLLLIGDSDVGKSSILLRFIDDVFEHIHSTIGVDFKLKILNINGKKVKLTIWDTAGQERFRTLTASYYRGVDGAILVYDITNRNSFENLQNIWIKELNMYSTTPSVKMLVGNKIDQESRVVTRDEGKELAQSLGTMFFECSAKTKIGVSNAFEELVMKIIDSPEISDIQQNSIIGSNTTVKTSGCC